MQGFHRVSVSAMWRQTESHRKGAEPEVAAIVGQAGVGHVVVVGGQPAVGRQGVDIGSVGEPITVS